MQAELSGEGGIAMRWSLGILAVILLTFLRIGPATACYGGAPLAMGGAYIAQAAGSLAIYWNPAGLGFTAPGVTFSDTFSHPFNEINYNRFYGVTAANGQAGVGLGVTELADWFPMEQWQQASAGFRINGQNAIGFTYRRETPRNAPVDYGWDFGWQYRSGALALGLLVQDAGTAWENIRPGVAWTIPKVTLAFNVYDLKNRNGAFGYCIGAEYRPWPFLALRVGSYLENKTAGIGFVWKNATVDWAYLGDDLGGVQHVTVGFRF